MGLIRTYHDLIRSGEAPAAGIVAGTTLLAMFAAGIAISAVRSGDVLGAVEAGGVAIGLGGVALDTAVVHDRAQLTPPS